MQIYYKDIFGILDKYVSSLIENYKKTFSNK